MGVKDKKTDTPIDIRRHSVLKLMRKRRFASVKKSLELAKVVELFEKYNVEGFPVVDHNGHILGEITELQLLPFAITPEEFSEHDIIGALGTKIHKFYRTKVEDVMTKHEIVITSDRTIEDAAYLIWKNEEIRCLPVIDEKTGKYKGTIYQEDIIDFVKKYKKELIK